MRSHLSFSHLPRKKNESRCFVFAAFCNLSIEGEREEGSSPAVRFKGEVWPNLWEGGDGWAYREKGRLCSNFPGPRTKCPLYWNHIMMSVLYCTHCSKKSAKKLLLDNVLLLLAVIASSSSAKGAQPEKQKFFYFGSSSQGTQWLFENKYAQTNEKNRERFPICFLKDCFQPSRLYLFISLFFFYKPLHRLPFHSVS